MARMMPEMIVIVNEDIRRKLSAPSFRVMTIAFCAAPPDLLQGWL